MNYYNEFNPKAAAMLRQLINDGLLPNGFVDERSIIDVRSEELKEFTQCHFFAGIGGWSYALQLAHWPTDRPVWTGSCPCQPFSSAGRGGGQADERHLWPSWFNLIRESKPAVIFGEQVANAITKGWLDDVYKGLESEGYAVGSAVLPACAVGAPHRRDRLWFVAHAEHYGRTAEKIAGSLEASIQYDQTRQNDSGDASGTSRSSNVADSASAGFSIRNARTIYESGQESGFERCGGNGLLADADGNGWEQKGQSNPASECNGIKRDSGVMADTCRDGWGQGRDDNGQNVRSEFAAESESGNVADTQSDGRRQSDQNSGGGNSRSSEEQRPVPGDYGEGSMADSDSSGLQRHARHGENGYQSRRIYQEPNGSAWQSGVWIDCPDGKQRLIEPSICLLADGIPTRVAELHAFGNAIVPQVAAEVIKAYMQYPSARG